MLPRRKNISHIQITAVSKNAAEGKSVMTSMTGSSLPEHHLKDFFQKEPAQKLAAGLLSAAKKDRQQEKEQQLYRDEENDMVLMLLKSSTHAIGRHAESCKNPWLVHRVQLTFSLPSLISPPPESAA